MLTRMRSLLIIVLCFSAMSIYAVWYIPILMLFGPEKTVRYRQQFGRLLLRSTFCRLEIIGEVPDADRACVYVANHQSMFDALIVAVAIPGNFSAIGKKSLLKIPVFGSIVKRMGFIFIDRQNLRDAGRSVIQAKDKIAAGVSVMIFPEGTRSKTGEIGTFKSGAFKLALETKAPIVPMGISGSFKANPGGWIFHPGVLRVVFGKAIEYEKYKDLSIEGIADLSKERIISLSGNQ